METERHAGWVARVVAWHNRHPLAQRIASAQVQGLGYVDLPYSAHDAKRRRDWRAVFSEKFLPGLATKRIARWALRHGQDTLPAERDAPVRQLPIDRSQLPPDGLALVLWVGTAAVQVGDVQTRVLVAPTAPHAVLGRRLWSRRRLAAAGTALTLLLATLPALRLLHRAPPPDEDDEPVAVAVAAPVKASAVAPVKAPAAAPQAEHPAEHRAEHAAEAASAPAVQASPASASTAAPASEPAAAVAAVAAPPRPPAPFPPRRPVIDEASKIAAQREVAAARAARATAQGRTVYALVTPRQRTQAESEIQGATLQAALANAEVPRGLRVEALPAGRDWRAVCWPFLDRGDAERLREQLAARGQHIEVVAF